MSNAATVHRVFNFAAGPAVLPVPVLEEIQRDMLALPGVGMSILEISHRSKTFERWLTSRMDMPTPGSASMSRWISSSTVRGSTAGPGEKL